MYLDYYALSEPPFSITPNPRFLFYSAKHREALNHMLYGIRERKGFVQITGEVGAGKSTLCRALLGQLGKNYSTALILNPVLDSDQLMRAKAMARAFPVVQAIVPGGDTRQSSVRAGLDEIPSSVDVIVCHDAARPLAELSGCRLATSHPNSARRFFEATGTNVEIVPISGAVEVAPRMGLADGIVDLVDTGRTLAENDLEVREEIITCTARLVANRVAHKLRAAEVDRLADRMREATG